MVRHFFGWIKLKQKTQRQRRQGWRGQSFVEFAFALPVMLVITAGLLEVGNVLLHYNRLQLAIREGARYGAAGGGETTMRDVIRDSVAHSLNMHEDYMQVWVIRPTVEIDSGDWFWRGGDRAATTWGASEECIFPLAMDTVSGLPGDTTKMCDPAGSGVSPRSVMDDVKQIGTGAKNQDIKGEILVVVVGYYEVPSILNLPFWQVSSGSSGRIPIRAYTVIRQELKEGTVNQMMGGCSAYPIALHEGITSARTNHSLDPDLNQAREGDVYNDIPYTTGGFQFLEWRLGSLTKDSMQRPGNATDPTRGYQWGTDKEMHRGDQVLISHDTSGVMFPLKSNPDSHVNTGRTLRVIVFEYTASTINGLAVRIKDFAIIRVLDFKGSGEMTFEFIRWDRSCGYTMTGTP